MSMPRGYRLNNPLNIERTDTVWVGMSSSQPDDRFVNFDTPEHGIRAAARTLNTYHEVHGINTMRRVIERWAPPKENDTSAYIAAVAIWSDIEPDDVIDLADYDTVHRLLRAMARMELGKPPKGTPDAWYDDATWERGLRLAGLVRQKPLVNSRIVKGAGTAASAIVAAQATLTDAFGIPSEIAGMLPAALAQFSGETVALVLLGIGFAGAIYAAYARRDDKAKGRL